MRGAAAMVAAVLLAPVLGGCGGGGGFANQPRPATPVNLSVYIDDSRVSVSPASVGAGQVVFVVTNQARSAQSLVIHPAGNPTRSLARTGPISSLSTDQLTVDLSRPGEYTLAAASHGRRRGTEAQRATAPATAIRPAVVHIGRPRPSSSNTLLEP